MTNLTQTQEANEMYEHKTHKECVRIQAQCRRAAFKAELARDKDYLDHLMHYARKAKFDDLSTARELYHSIYWRHKMIEVKTALACV